MKYWWVNQNQTYKYEVPGGYLWSPKKSKDGRTNPFYDFMTEVSPGDAVFSFCDTYIKAIGIVQSHHKSAKKPMEFNGAGDYWSDDGWLVPVKFYEIDKSELFRPKDHIDTIRPFSTYTYAPLKANGDGKQAIYLTTVRKNLAELLLDLAKIDINEIMDRLYEVEADEEESRIKDDEALSTTTKLSLVESRRGQGKFKKNVKALSDKCFLTGVDESSFLIASHIKPWAKCNNFERLDGNNGLLLVPHIDHLFDKGYISFSDDSELLISPRLSAQVCELYNLSQLKSLFILNDEQKTYLAYHREYIFK